MLNVIYHVIFHVRTSRVFSRSLIIKGRCWIDSRCLTSSNPLHHPCRTQNTLPRHELLPNNPKRLLATFKFSVFRINFVLYNIVALLVQIVPVPNKKPSQSFCLELFVIYDHFLKSVSHKIYSTYCSYAFVNDLTFFDSFQQRRRRY